jgi:hypothetical protein
MSYTKEYLNNTRGKIKSFPNGGHIIDISFSEDDIKEMKTSVNQKTGKRSYYFTLGQRREEDQFGNTHYAYVSKKVDGASTPQVAAPVVASPAIPNQAQNDLGVGNGSEATDDMPF